MRWAVALMGVLCAAATAPPPPCETCHPAETAMHVKTRMAHAMSAVGESAFAQNVPAGQPLRESGDGYAMRYARGLAGLTVQAQRGADQAQGTIEWMVGAGAQGETPLVETAGGTAESRVSYFPELHQYGITVGQDGGASANAEAALGRRLNRKDLQACLGCHTTAVTADLQPVTPGVQCVRCHAGAEEHAAGHGVPANPGKFAAPDQVKFCGNCHRNKAPVNDAQLENLRFQPLRLMKSKCFVASGKLACTTCHPAHMDARRNDAAFYNAKCGGCHAGQAHAGDARQTGDCIGCHMPYVELHPALHFTDHYIRVVKKDDLPAEIVRARPGG